VEIEPFQEKIIKQLIDQETMLSKLYTLFSEQFPECQKFWKNLSKAEERHAKLIEKLLEAAKKGIVFFDEGKMKSYTLAAFLTRLESIVQKAQRCEYSLTSAFVCAMDYESSLIEKNVFTHFDSLGEKAKTTLKILQSETIDHVEHIRNAQKKILKTK